MLDPRGGMCPGPMTEPGGGGEARGHGGRGSTVSLSPPVPLSASSHTLLSPPSPISLLSPTSLHFSDPSLQPPPPPRLLSTSLHFSVPILAPPPQGLMDADPYWTRAWPSAIALAATLLRRPELVRAGVMGSGGE